MVARAVMDRPRKGEGKVGRAWLGWRPGTEEKACEPNEEGEREKRIFLFLLFSGVLANHFQIEFEFSSNFSQS